MANNPYVNRVETADGSTLMDITDTTAQAGDVSNGMVFYSASGARTTGTMPIKLDQEAAYVAYSSSGTYSVGDIRTHSGKIYRCSTPISTAEEWNSSHWTEVTIEDLFGLKADRVSNATSGNVATLDANGNLVDSGKTLGKSVPSDAVFTDTTYSAGSGLALSGTAFRVDVPRVAETANHLPGTNSFQLREYTAGTTYNLPSNAWYHIYEAKGSDGNYGTQLALGMTTSDVYYRNYNNGSWQAWKSLANVGTITGINMNGASKGTSGVVDLGTVITAHQDISGKKNTQTAVSDPTASGTSATFIATISQDTQGVITATKKTVRSASTSQSGLMSAADKTKLDNTGVKSGNNNWWEAPNGQLCAYKYEGHNTTTYKLPHPHVVVLVMKESNTRGVALAIRWNDSANAMWIARLHGGTANTFSSWTPIVTSENESTYFSNHLHWLSYSGKTSANGNLKVSDNLGDRWVVYAYCSNGSVIATPYWGSGSSLWVHFTSDNAARSVIASTNVSGAVAYIS